MLAPPEGAVRIVGYGGPDLGGERAADHEGSGVAPRRFDHGRQIAQRSDGVFFHGEVGAGVVADAAPLVHRGVPRPALGREAFFSTRPWRGAQDRDAILM
jgi:hypothetical protein